MYLQTGFALHQEPRLKKFREKIIAPPGYTIVEWDAVSQEFRWAAELSGDEVMKALCEPGEDAHTYMTARIYQEDYRALYDLVKADDTPTVKKRKGGKVANLQLQYRTGYRKLLSIARVEYDMDMELPLAKKIHATYPQTYKGMPAYWAKQIAKGQRLGYAENLAGRRVEVKGDWSRGSTFKWALESTMINFPIQSTGADQKYLALACLKNELTTFGASFLMDLHDGLLFLVPDDRFKAFAEVGKRILDNLPYQRMWDYTPSVPLPWDVKAGPSWGRLKNIE